MPKYLDTKGNTTLGIGICQRCWRKFPLGELMDDPNIRGFKVCKDDKDLFDPYRLPARSPDKITLPFIRPDTPLSAPPTLDWQVDPDPVEPFPRDTGS
jgi:hypothetical protein